MATTLPTWILKIRYQGDLAGTLIFRPEKKLEIKDLTSRELAKILRGFNKYGFYNMVGEQQGDSIAEGHTRIPLSNYKAWVYVSSELASMEGFEVEEIRVDKSARSKVNA